MLQLEGYYARTMPMNNINFHHSMQYVYLRHVIIRWNHPITPLLFSYSGESNPLVQAVDNSRQQSALEDYVEAALMLQYNK